MTPSAIFSAASTRAMDSIAERIDASRAGSARSCSTSAGTVPIWASGTTTAPPPRSKWRAFSVW